MDQKLSPLFCFLATWTLVSTCSSNTDCVRPANMIPITSDQIKGVWFHVMDVDTDADSSIYSCDRFEFLFKTANKGIGTRTLFDKRDGQFKLSNFDMEIWKDGSVHFQPFDLSYDDIVYNIILQNDKELVASICFFVHGRVDHKYHFVLMRSQGGTQDRYIELLKQANVTYKHHYLFDQPAKCYKL